LIADVVTRNRGRAIAIFLLVLGGLQISPAPSGSLEQVQDWNSLAEEPITPVPAPPAIDPLKIRLGERLFGDPRLSHDNSRSCSSCHDLGTNGATTRNLDVGLDGSTLSLNTLTLFNSKLNFRFGWEGKLRTLELDAKATL
jgi:cytochrome c peroxidase